MYFQTVQEEFKQPIKQLQYQFSLGIKQPEF